MLSSVDLPFPESGARSLPEPTHLRADTDAGRYRERRQPLAGGSAAYWRKGTLVNSAAIAMQVFPSRVSPNAGR